MDEVPVRAIPDGQFESTAVAAHGSRDTLLATAVFPDTLPGTGGPGEPTGKPAASDCTYIIGFDGDRIARKTKIRNDTQALRQLGWA